MTIRRVFISAVIYAAICLTGPLRAQNGQPGLGFSSPQAVLQSLQARADVRFLEKDGWTVAIDEPNHTVWLFAHQGDPAYPTVVKRAPTQTSQGWVIGSQIMCGGTQAACNKIAAMFAQ